AAPRLLARVDKHRNQKGLKQRRERAVQPLPKTPRTKPKRLWKGARPRHGVIAIPAIPTLGANLPQRYLRAFIADNARPCMKLSAARRPRERHPARLALFERALRRRNRPADATQHR